MYIYRMPWDGHDHLWANFVDILDRNFVLIVLRVGNYPKTLPKCSTFGNEGYDGQSRTYVGANDCSIMGHYVPLSDDNFYVHGMPCIDYIKGHLLYKR